MFTTHQLCTKYFINVSSLIPQSNPMRHILFPHLNMRKLRLIKASYTVSQDHKVSDKVRVRIHMLWIKALVTVFEYFFYFVLNFHKHKNFAHPLCDCNMLPDIENQYIILFSIFISIHIFSIIVVLCN